ncbi:MAG: V-type ATP synthase subunit E family protein [bacterium]
MSSQGKNYDLLISEIKKQSRKEIKEIKEQAEKERQETISKARKEGEKIRSEMMSEAEQKCDDLKKKILSGVHLEIKKKNLDNQEKLIFWFNAEVRKRLDRFRSSDQYKQILKEWIIEGISAIDKKDLIITVGEVEKKFTDKKYLQQAIDFIKDKQGKNLTCRVSDEILNEGGVIITDLDEKISFDNSFSARMQRKQDEIRLLIVEKFIG